MSASPAFAAAADVWTVVVMHPQDLENTTGSWDLYGQDDNKRYPGMQNEFFNRAGDILKRREALRGFAALCKWTCMLSSFGHIHMFVSASSTLSRCSIGAVFSFKAAVTHWYGQVVWSSLISSSAAAPLPQQYHRAGTR
jgi:hypothetical protein